MIILSLAGPSCLIVPLIRRRFVGPERLKPSHSRTGVGHHQFKAKEKKNRLSWGPLLAIKSLPFILSSRPSR